MGSERVRRPHRGGRVDKTGRNIGGPRHVRLYHWFLNSPAWQSLTPQSRALYIELSQLYNGSNNGELWLSVRDAARRIHVAKDTALRCFRELEDRGFISAVMRGDFNYKIRNATTWKLTEHPVGDAAETKDFMRWPAEKSEHGPNPSPKRPKKRSKDGRIRKKHDPSVPDLGPQTRSSTSRRSQTEARI